ncbi:MAG: hypothetical protein ACFBRM_04095 [Pikeienuella sp.]
MFDEEPSSPFIPAPDPTDDQSTIAWAEALVVEQGLQTGLLGAGLLAVAALFGLICLVRLGAMLVERLTAHYVSGEVIGVEHAEGGGLHPVVAVPDRDGRRRRVVVDFKVLDDPTGQSVLMRIDGKRARPAVPPVGRLRQIMRLTLPFLIALAAAATALTGRVLGVIDLP